MYYECNDWVVVSKMILSSWEDVHFAEYFAIAVKPPTRKTFEI